MSFLPDVNFRGPDPKGVVLEAPGAFHRETLHLARSPAMKELYKQIEKVAGVEVPVLFLGESGVGKEFFAKHLHQLSGRRSRPFLKVNCAALPSELLESELFGYEAGAFTGATRSKPGQFEFCNEGTILLDEIAEMPPAMQAKLLHVLQDQGFSRLGGRRIIQVNVRILAATNVNIEEALAQHRFRLDLYYRLNTVILRIPPLRERPDDIPLFLEQFISETAAQFGTAPRPVSSRLWEACLEYSWPGNVRELQSFACRFLLRDNDESLIAELRQVKPPDSIETDRGADPSFANTNLKSLGRKICAEAEKQVIEETLLETRWNRTEAARVLRISYKTLHNKIRQYGISAIPRTPLPGIPNGSTEAADSQMRTPRSLDSSHEPDRLPRRSLVGRYATDYS